MLAQLRAIFPWAEISEQGNAMFCSCTCCRDAAGQTDRSRKNSFNTAPGVMLRSSWAGARAQLRIHEQGKGHQAAADAWHGQSAGPAGGKPTTGFAPALALAAPAADTPGMSGLAVDSLAEVSCVFLQLGSICIIPGKHRCKWADAAGCSNV